MDGGYDNDFMDGRGGRRSHVGWLRLRQRSLGGDGNDTIFAFNPTDADGDGSSSGDIIEGRSGNDVLNGSGGDDYISGGNDDDLLDGNLGDDTLEGGLGADTLHGGDGDDELYAYALTSSSDVATNVLYGESGIDLLLGAEGDDELNGGDGDDNLLGWSGADRLSGGGGNDILHGGAGADQLRGGLGNDLFIVDAQGEAIEAADQGIDMVRSTVSYALGANIERLQLLGTGSISAPAMRSTITSPAIPATTR